MKCRECEFKKEVLKIFDLDLYNVGKICKSCPAEDKSESAYEEAPKILIRAILRAIIEEYAKVHDEAKVAKELQYSLEFVSEVLSRCPNLDISTPYFIKDTLGFSMSDISDYLSRCPKPEIPKCAKCKFKNKVESSKRLNFKEVEFVCSNCASHDKSESLLASVKTDISKYYIQKVAKIYSRVEDIKKVAKITNLSEDLVTYILVAENYKKFGNKLDVARELGITVEEVEKYIERNKSKRNKL